MHRKSTTAAPMKQTPEQRAKDEAIERKLAAQKAERMARRSERREEV